MTLVTDLALYKDGATGDMYYRNASGLLVPVTGTQTTGYVPTKQGDGSIAWAAGSGGGSAPAWVTSHPDTPPTSPTTFSGTVYDLEFVRDNALSTGTTIGSPVTAPSIVDRSLRIVSGTSATSDVKGREWVCPGSAFTMTAKLRKKMSTATFAAFGPFVRRNASSTGNFMMFTSVMSSFPGSLNIQIDKYTTETSRSSSGSSNTFGALLWLSYYMQIQYDGTNLIFRFSFTGHADSYITYVSETAATFLGGAPGRFGIGMDNFGTTANSGYCEWIRFT